MTQDHFHAEAAELYASLQRAMRFYEFDDSMIVDRRLSKTPNGKEKL